MSFRGAPSLARWTESITADSGYGLRACAPRGASRNHDESCACRRLSDRRKDEVRLQASLLCAAHHGTQKHGFELAAVIGEVTMRLAEDRNDLRHLETER